MTAQQPVLHVYLEHYTNVLSCLATYNNMTSYVIDDGVIRKPTLGRGGAKVILRKGEELRDVYIC